LAQPRKTVTALRSRGAGRVAVEVEGEHWRILPAEVVVRAGLARGIELERPLLRTLRRELRRHRALATAARALRARPLSAQRLDERLRQAGFVAAERTEALAAVRHAGFLDDERFAAARAELLAGRGSGDALIRHDLRSQGIAGEAIEQGLAALEPEAARAARAAAARRGGAAATARYLARRGFGEEAIEAALRSTVADEP
jgi:SOS response regulatory protein OraA/RecX